MEALISSDPHNLYQWMQHMDLIERSSDIFSILCYTNEEKNNNPFIILYKNALRIR